MRNAWMSMCWVTAASFYHRKYLNTSALPVYVMNNTVLEEVDEIKDLGVYYDFTIIR